MDFNDAARKLKKENPDCNETDLRAMLQSQIDLELARFKGRDKYVAAVESAFVLMSDWLHCGNDFAVTLDWKELASFATHTPACVYCVFIAKSRAAVEAIEGHAEHQKRVGIVNCSAAHVNFGGGCLNCGWGGAK